MKSKAAKATCITVSAIILVVVFALNVAVGIFSEELDRHVIGYKPGSHTSADRAAGAALAEQIQYEGTVLVENENDVLPLDKASKKVNVFGWAAVDWVYSGSGSGRVAGTLDRNNDKYTQLENLLTALEGYGAEYNEELAETYTRFQSRRYKADPLESVNDKSGTLHSFNYEFSRLYEPSISDKTFYSDSILENAKKFSDTALVVLGRVSGESNDSPKVQYKKNSASDTIVVDETRTYLEISTEEEELLTYVGKNYDKVVVIINSTSVMELGFLKTIEGIDACLIVATTGTSGATAIPKMLWGDCTPSGKTADTYAYDLSTSPTYVNTGSGIKGASGGEDTTNFYTDGAGLYPTTVKHTNGSSRVAYSGVAYTDYAESIYVGYKWYETADVAGFWELPSVKERWNIKNGYDDVVQYPFGYGKSYTEFTWEVAYSSVDNNATVTSDDEIEIEVKVTNVGDHPGQDVVELYYSAPYTSGIEKSALNLIAFGKTQQVLEPGMSEFVVLKFKVEDMKSYDYDDANHNGFKGYELESGEYVISLRTDAHTLASEKLTSGSAELKLNVEKGENLTTDSASGNVVENLFTGTDVTDGVAIDGNSDGTAQITYLSRKNFENTFPYKQADNRAMAQVIKELNLYDSKMANAWDASHPSEPIETGADYDIVVCDDSGITEFGEELADPKNYYNDALWVVALNQLTETEMLDLALHGYIKTSKLSTIGKPETSDLDGPNQIGSFDNTTNGLTGFSSIVLAQSWNSELAYSMGLAIAREAAKEGVSGWYGPALNLHRSPFGGRNYEYYSEDAYLSGIMAAQEVRAAKNAGVFAYLKHLCLYESESGRDGMYNWLTEQALREAYVKPFEICVKEGGATGIMTSYGRIGAVWTGGSEALLTELVRNEWGFKGAIITDYADNHEYMNGDQMLRAGGDLWMDGVGWTGKFTIGSTSSNAFRKQLQNASKHVLYTWLNALAANKNYNESGDGVPIYMNTRVLNFRWYIPALIAVDAAAILGCGALIFFAVRKKKPNAVHDS